MKVNRVDGFGKDGVVTTNCTKRSSAGFTLIELVIVLGIILILTTVAVLSLPSALRSAHMNTAVQTTLAQIRQARQEAMDRRMLYTMTFTVPGTILIQRRVGGVLVNERTIPLPSDVTFRAVPGATNIPDNFGTGANAIDFNSGNVISFLPDGSSLDPNGNPNNGVIYLRFPAGVNGARAISMFGATGRLTVWQLSGGMQWQ